MNDKVCDRGRGAPWAKYDWIHFECFCPKCHTTVNGFQSKDLICGGYWYDFWEVTNFMAICGNCPTTVEFDLIGKFEDVAKSHDIGKYEMRTWVGHVKVVLDYEEYKI